MRKPVSPTTYEGRALVRPDDEVVDQGLGFDVVTLMGRRQMLRAMGLGAVGIGLAACGTTAATGNSGTSSSSSAASGSATTSASAEIHDETAGPTRVTVPTDRTFSVKVESSAVTSGPASAEPTPPPRVCR